MASLRPLLVELTLRAVHNALPDLLRWTLLGSSATRLRYGSCFGSCFGDHFLNLLNTAIPQFFVMLALLDMSCLHDQWRVDGTAILDRGLVTALFQLLHACGFVQDLPQRQALQLAAQVLIPKEGRSARLLAAVRLDLP